MTASETVEADEIQESSPESGTDPLESEDKTEGSSSEETAPTESAENSGQQTPRRLRLNPTLGKGEAKAIPSLSTSTPDGSLPVVVSASGSPPETQNGQPETGDEIATTGTQPESSSSGEQTENTEQAESESSQLSSAEESESNVETEQKTPLAATGGEPVDIPPKIDELGEDLEAEIEAAMSQESLESVTVETPSTAEESTTLPPEDELEEGTRLPGKIQSIHGDDVFLDLGYRSPGVVSQRQFDTGKKPGVGQVIEVIVDRVDREEGLILVNLPKGMRRARGNWDDLASGQIVDCMVNKTNKGGLEISVGNIRGFLPASQVELAFVSDLEPYVGQKLRVKIIEANRRKRNLVVSRRDFLQIERQQAQEELWKTLEVGQQFPGTVKSIKDFGAFIDIGGVDGFLHVGEISWTRIKHPSEILQQGQQVEVKVLSLDPEKQKIGLGMRQLVPNPWTTATVNYPVGTAVSGKVTRIADFGAFVELEPGLEGMVHISELDYKRVNRVADVLETGQQIDLKVLEVNPDRKRISLSLKALMEKPEEMTTSEQADASETKEAPRRKRKSMLKGGTGTKSGKGGLFGDPKDYQ